jgi:hypothetical protein
MSMRTGNSEPLWDKIGAVPSTANAHPKKMPAPVKFFYKKLQYRGSVDYGKRGKEQPLPKSLDILHKDGIDLDRMAATPGDSGR